MADGNFNMFDVGQQRLEEQMFSAEKTKRDEEIFNKNVESMCIRLGVSKDTARAVPGVIQVVNRAFATKRHAPCGYFMFNGSLCAKDDLMCVVEAEMVKDSETLDGFPASKHLSDDQRRRIYATFEEQQEVVDDVVVRRLFDELAETQLLDLPTDDKELLWSFIVSLQPSSHAEVMARAKTMMDKAAADI